MQEPANTLAVLGEIFYFWEILLTKTYGILLHFTNFVANPAVLYCKKGKKKRQQWVNMHIDLPKFNKDYKKHQKGNIPTIILRTLGAFSYFFNIRALENILESRT